MSAAKAAQIYQGTCYGAFTNNLRPYYYFKHLLTELPKRCDEEGNIDPAMLDFLLPWAKELPDECRKPRR